MQLPIMLGRAMPPHLHRAACSRAGCIQMWLSCDVGACVGLSPAGVPPQHVLPHEQHNHDANGGLGEHHGPGQQDRRWRPRQLWGVALT